MITVVMYLPSGSLDCLLRVFVLASSTAEVAMLSRKLLFFFKDATGLLSLFTYKIMTTLISISDIVHYTLKGLAFIDCDPVKNRNITQCVCASIHL